jgi:phosphoglycolate phosphatase
MSAGTRAVLFDLDGTLVDTPGGMTTVLADVARAHGREPDPAVLRRTVGRPLAASLATLLALPADDSQVTEAVEQARKLFTEQVIPKAPDLVFPGVHELLADLHDRGTEVAVVTSKVHRSAVELLGAAGLLSSFDVLSCHGMTPRGKPHADLALLASERLGVAPRECLVVGDAIDDMRMACAAGMAGHGVDFGVATRRELLDAGALTVSGSVGELRRALEPTGQRPTPA